MPDTPYIKHVIQNSETGEENTAYFYEEQKTSCTQRHQLPHHLRVSNHLDGTYEDMTLFSKHDDFTHYSNQVPPEL